ncbi:MAG TPA: alpha/beta fold hydrolase, partial [Anaerolineae bacterium]|nr:alpha/beta fold hydrolase [Anaerolineae bacterium]
MTVPIAAPALYHRVLVAGPQTRPPLLLLHGFTGDRRSWLGFAAAWRRLQAGDRADGRHHGYRRRVIALDLPGHGRSPQPADPAARTMPGVVAEVQATIDALGITRAHVLGYSMGGRVALSLALAVPERVASLSLIGASPGIADAAERDARAAA